MTDDRRAGQGPPKKAFPDNTSFLGNTLPGSGIHAMALAKEMGSPGLISTSFPESDAKDAGTMLASLFREVQAYGTPVKPPCVLLPSGEVTTTILDNATIRGHGGRGQEMTVSFAIAAAKTKGACLFSIDGERTDGTAKGAGGIIEPANFAAAHAKGINLCQSRCDHSCFEALDAIGSAVYTGNTGTNPCDMNTLCVPAVPCWTRAHRSARSRSSMASTALASRGKSVPPAGPWGRGPRRKALRSGCTRRMCCVTGTRRIARASAC